MNTLFRDAVPSTLPPGQVTADILAAQAGDQQAFARLVDATRTTVSSIALAIVRDVRRSEEIAAEVLVATWRGLPKLRDAKSFGPWLRQLTRNRAQQHLRESARARRSFARDESAIAAAIDPDKTAEGILVDREEKAALAAALAELPDDTREIVVLFYREGQSIAQVAALLDIPEATARKRLQRARDALRASVLERLGEIARKTAPGAAFTAAVLAAITAAAPATAAAATLAVGGKIVSATKVGGFVASLPAALLGTFVVLLPLRKQLRLAIDERERRHLRWVAGFALVGLAVFTVGMNLTLARRDPAFMIAGYTYMQLSFFVLYGYALPRIVRRRLAAEVAADPSAAKRHRRERFWSLFGLISGAVCGTLGVWYAATLGR
jgi:RNA polymerase sigma factor (sigma-70 family)